MKILKVKVITKIIGSQWHHTRPKEYDISKARVLAHESASSQAGGEAMVARAVDVGGVLTAEEYLIALVKDVDAPAFLASADIIEITKAEAIALGDAILPPVTKCLDEALVLRVLEKYRTGAVVTPEELKAIDPQDATKGVNEATFLKRINRNLAR